MFVSVSWWIQSRDFWLHTAASDQRWWLETGNVCVCGGGGTGCATGWWEGERGQWEGVKMNEWVDDEGDWGQEAICSKEGPTGIWGQKCVCVGVCVYMSDSVVLGHLDYLPTHAHTHTRTSLFFPHLTSSPSTRSPPKPCLSFPNLSLHGLSLTPQPSSSTLHVSIPGLTLGQSLLVGLVARFPSGPGINSRLLTLTRPDWAKANLFSFSLPALLWFRDIHYHPNTHKPTTGLGEKVY